MLLEQKDKEEREGGGERRWGGGKFNSEISFFKCHKATYSQQKDSNCFTPGLTFQYKVKLVDKLPLHISTVIRGTVSRSVTHQSVTRSPWH